MDDREKLIELIGNVNVPIMRGDATVGEYTILPCEVNAIADHLIANGVTFATDNNVGDKRIEELEAKLAEREEALCNLRKKWQAAETHICTMCRHFDRKTDGNIVYGNKSCGEIVGYPCCGKFTPWIPVTERLPEIPDGWAEHPDPVLYMMASTGTIKAGYYGENGTWRDKYFREYHDIREGVDAADVRCWMWQHDLPEPPKGE